MKKMIFLLLSVGSFSAIFAQDRRDYDKDNARTVLLGREEQHAVYVNNIPRKDDGAYKFDPRRKQEEINKVTWDYNRRIEAVKNDRHLRRKEKSREINRLQHEKEQAIRDINARYERRR